MSSRKASTAWRKVLYHDKKSHVHHDTFDGSYGWSSFGGPQVPVIPADMFGWSIPGPIVMEHCSFSCSRARHLLLDTPGKS